MLRLVQQDLYRQYHLLDRLDLVDQLLRLVQQDLYHHYHLLDRLDLEDRWLRLNLLGLVDLWRQRDQQDQ